ncbi:transcriptional regulator [Rhodococcoides trifolii]|uniref:Transcriptional regulator n=1 Tax=Rhodococcoides trifolii TaxID=908250 RepID=A0A917CZ79_9NOCA|nr:GAF and ANTAR domain-containing protein [Rhodococcus trifolii]GGG03669.1 transcriptional regulator [Rhodococcus trifolii]
MDNGHAEAALAPRVMAAAEFGRIVLSLGPRIENDDDLLELLQRAADSVRTVIPSAQYCSVTVDFDKRTYTAVYTDSKTLEIDKQQYRTDQGPCLHAARTGETVVVDCDETDDRWPEFGPAARSEGVHSFLAAPVLADTDRFGAVNIYGEDPSAFDDVDAELLSVVTSAVGRAIGDFARYRTVADIADGLREAMAHRAPIEQAKGILMALRGIDADTAFEVLADQSQRTNRKLRDVAADFVATASGKTE